MRKIYAPEFAIIVLPLLIYLEACSLTPRFPVESNFLGETISTTVDSEIARYYLESYLQGSRLNKNYKHPSIFTPENLLREAKRQKNITDHKVPRICLLDPDGDIVQHLRSEKMASINPYWACYHTKMYIFQYGEIEYGIIGYAVGSIEGDFEKGFDNGSGNCMQLIHITAKTWMTRNL
jgi:hypothetical protein